MSHNGPVTSRRDTLKGAAALGLGGLIGAGSVRTVRAQSGGGTLRVASSPAPNLDPVKMEAAGSIAIVQQVAEYLVWAEPDLSLRPVLATRWATEDGGRTWVFDIREGVKWHDGRELTADDVVATFQRLVDPEVASAGAAQLSFLKKEGVTKLGPHRVQFALDRPIGQFPYFTHIYNAVILPADYAGDFQSKPIGTGPFRMTEFRPQEGASFERNPDYWDAGKPTLDKVEVLLFESPQAEILAMQGGQVDVILHASHIDAQPFTGNPDVNVVAVPAAEHRQLTMRCDQKPFDDVRVRRAVALAMRRPELVQGLLGGNAEIGNDHPIASIYPEKTEVAQRAFDLEAAKALLAEAGYADGLEVDLYAPQYLELPQYAQLIKQMLEPIGITVTLKLEPLSVYYEHWTKVSFGLTDWTSRPTPEQILATAFKGGAEWNVAKWQNAEFDAAVDELTAEPDPAKRTALTQRAAAIMNDEVPAVIAYFNRNLRPMSRKVQGVDGSISQFLDLTRASLA